MTSDIRTNEPTDEQVEAAAKALYEVRPNGDIAWDSAKFDDWMEREDYRVKARAALVAAQGAAPQAEGDELAWYKAAAKHSADSMAEARATLQQLADRVDPFVFDELSSVLDDQPLDYETGDVIGEAAPVLPSSGVDEDALAEVIRKLRFDDEGCWADGIDCTESVSDHADAIARAVAEWLKGQRR